MKASLVLLAAATALAGCVVMDPQPRGGGPAGSPQSPRATVAYRFDDRQRATVREYYAEEFRRGRDCPPGLAKKNNGCMPPGLASKPWTRGRPLPREVQYYPLPREIEVRIGLPPPDHRYVRVASDILLIAIGTMIVVDAIEDLGR